MFELRYFLGGEGDCPFEDWFCDLDAVAAAKVTVALARVEQAIFPTSKTWARVFLNTGLIGGRDTGSISGGTGTFWSFC